MALPDPISFLPSGRVIRCVALDPDGLLWDGLLAEDGVDGIHPGEHTGLQASLKELAKSGVTLAVVSRNEPEDAILPFDGLPGMVLGRGDISLFEPSWNGKAEALCAIRDKLRIALSEIVYLDADPFQRGLVASTLPGVVTEAQAYSSSDEFLESLDMQMTMDRFDTAHLAQVAALLRRSTQYNLTTHHYTEDECEALSNDPGVLPLYVTLGDRLGDYGPVAVVVLSPQGEEMMIRDWVMSVRMLDRGVEHQLMNLVVSLAQSRGCTRLTAEYIRTPKNGAVSEFYAQFGFTMIGEEPDHTLWVLPLSAYEPFPTFVKLPPANPLGA